MAGKPVVGITMGDVTGVGPEIIVKSLQNEHIYNQSNPVVIGDAALLQRAADLLNIDVTIKKTANSTDFTAAAFGEILCYDLNLITKELPFGQVSPVAGNAAFEYLRAAIELSTAGKIDAICTAPLNKEAMQKAGHFYPGHTEVLAELTNTENYAMMLSTPNIKVIHATTHVGLIEAIERINPDRVLEVIKLGHEVLYHTGMKHPRIGVCGINPHAGENGLFGNEEEEEKIIPAVTAAQKEGIDATGPMPADTLFFRANRGDFDMVVAMYHDQGHIPVKMLGLESGVNITVGLPLIRTSVDHGTAFDIAGKGAADERSMVEAISQAIDLSSAGNPA